MRRALIDERGFALLVALWLLVALSAIGLEFGLRARARRLATANVLEATRARAVAEAGIAEAHAVLARRLATAAEHGRFDVNRLVDPWGGAEVLLRDTTRLDEVRYTVRLQDAGARLHLNRVTEEELRRLFGALRIDAGRADRLAQAILDWRDPDDLHRARGAEREDYLRAGAAMLPSNRPFDRLTELRQVAGMTPELYRRVQPHLTLLGTGQVNLNVAPRPVLLALPGLTEAAVAVILRRRAGRRPLRNLQELATELPTAPRAVLHAHLAELMPRVAFETREVVAASEGWLEGSPAHVTVEALFARGGQHAFLVWSQAR